MSGCDCPVAGFCPRHGIQKGERWHELCQTNEKYREAWDRQAAGIDIPRKIADIEASQKRLAKAGREAWRKLFTLVFTPDELREWERTIPAYGCKCKAFYKEWAKQDPPKFDASGRVDFAWKWKLKSAVNQKLGHANLSLEDAKAFWQAKADHRDS